VNHTLHENSRRAQPGRPIDPSKSGPAALQHADVVTDLLVRPDGSTIEAVRTNRLNGAVLGYEVTNGTTAAGTWARGHAAALYGFARMGLEFKRVDKVATAERLARYLQQNLPPTRIPPRDFPGSEPPDPDAGALYAAALLRLAEACEALPTACQDGAAAWRSLGRAMLDAFLARINPHVPVGAHPEGDTLFGVDYALEAIERTGA
jgi:hypothetical protein